MDVSILYRDVHDLGLAKSLFYADKIVFTPILKLVMDKRFKVLLLLINKTKM